MSMASSAGAAGAAEEILAMVVGALKRPEVIANPVALDALEDVKRKCEAVLASANSGWR